MASKRLEVVIGGDAKGAKEAFDDTEKGADSLGSRMSDALGKGALAVGVAGAAAVVGVGVALKGAWEAATESAKISGETERAIRTTGGAANVTADQVGDLAGTISELTGADDELIQGAANLMLTFTGVKNVVGEGNDVFDQSVGLSLDMATALGSDASDAAIQLGKALNDPIKGITALSRSGVSFTEQQKDQIKTMVEHGDTLGAQKVILAELAKEFGGAAEAAGTPLDKLMLKIGNFQEAIGGVLIPVVDSAVTWLGGKLTVAFDALTPMFEEVVGGVQAFAGAWSNASDGITSSGFAGTMEEWAIKLRPAFDAVARAVETAFGRIQEAVGWLAKPENDEAIKAAAFGVGTLLAMAFVNLGVSAATAAVGVLAATWPILAIVAAAAGLAFVFLKAYENLEWFRTILDVVKDTAIRFWNEALIPMVNWLRDVWVTDVWPKVIWVLDRVREAWPHIESAALSFWNVALKPIVEYITNNMDTFKQLGIALGVIAGIAAVVLVGALLFCVVTFGLVVASIAALVLALGVAFVTIMKLAQVWWDVFNNVRDAAGGVIDQIENVIQVFWDLAQNVGSAVASAVASFGGLAGRIGAAVGDLGGILFGAGQAVVQGLLNGIGSMAGAIGRKVSEIANSIPDWAKGALGIRSPSTVMMAIGMQAGEGLALGVERSAPVVDTASRGLTSAVTAAPSVGLAGRGRGAAPVIQITVNGFVGNQEQLGKEMIRQLTAAERQGVAMPWAS